jgi:hypothetical protein
MLLKVNIVIHLIFKMVMKNKGFIFIVVLLLTAIAVPLFGQDGVSPPADIKEFWELRKWTVILGGLLALIGILKNTGLDKKLEKFWFGRLLLSTISLILTFVGKKYVAYKIRRKETKASKASVVTKVLLIGLLLSGMSVSVSAQKVINKFIDPVTKERIADKSLRFSGEAGRDGSSAWFPRGAAIITGVKFHHDSEQGKFITEDFTRVGAGLEFAHYRVVNDEVINDYGIGAFFSPPLTTDPLQQYATVIVIGSIYDLGHRFKLEFLNGISIGGGFSYDINKDRPAKDNISFLPSFTITF